MNKIKRLITNIHFWMWAATHCESFRHFEIVMYPMIKVSWNVSKWSYEYLLVRISVYKPKFFYSVSTYAATEYAKSHGISTDVLYTLEDIPF